MKLGNSLFFTSELQKKEIERSMAKRRKIKADCPWGMNEDSDEVYFEKEIKPKLRKKMRS